MQNKNLLLQSVGFEAIARRDARLLILGTLPGKVSLERGEYYAQPRNAFWPIMEKLVGIAPDARYKDKILKLKENGIALWDVCAAGERSGSLDSAIRLSTVRPNDIGAFLRRHPHVGRICFNGQTAAKIYKHKIFSDLPQAAQKILCKMLPSTSPAHAAMSFERKLQHRRIALDEEGSHQFLKLASTQY